MLNYITAFIHLNKRCVYTCDWAVYMSGSRQCTVCMVVVPLTEGQGLTAEYVEDVRIKIISLTATIINLLVKHDQTIIKLIVKHRI